jgi:tRNA threonylcarbamoyladenosine biosynthesis protein TsaE
MRLDLPDVASMEAAARALAQTAGQPGVVYLEGELGTGKTTLVRGLLRALGYTGTVRSPTYTLVEPYVLGPLTVYHLDLYRLADPEELEWLGIRDLLGGEHLLLVEWPGNGAGVLPPPDLVLALDYHGDGRRLVVQAPTQRGRMLVAGLRETPWIVEE